MEMDGFPGFPVVRYGDNPAIQATRGYHNGFMKGDAKRCHGKFILSTSKGEHVGQLLNIGYMITGE